MELDIIKLQTTWNDAAGSINSNYAKIADAIAQLKANGGGAADTIVWSKVTNKPDWIIQAGNSKPKYSYDELTDTPDLSELATKTWVESELLSAYSTTAEMNSAIVAALNGYAKIEDIPTTVSQLTDSGDYLKKTSAEITYAKIASIQGFENRIGGLEGAVPQLNERVTIVEGKVSSLNETVSTGKNNLLYRVNTIETDYVTSGNLESAINGIDLSAYLLKADLTKSRIQSTLGISDWALAATKPSYAWSEITSRPTALSQFTDDVVAGKYLRSTIYGNFDADTLFNDGFQSGNILHLPSGGPYGIVHTLSYRGGSNNAKPDYATQIFIPCGDDRTSPNDMFFRTSLADAWNAWTKVITDKNISNYNAGSATKLQTRCKLWGNSFDGTGDVSGNLYSDIWRIVKDSGTGGVFFQVASYNNLSDLGIVYITARNGNDLLQCNIWATKIFLKGNVGIGTTSPTERLDVNGNIKTNAITIGGVTLSWDSVNNALVVNGNMYGTGSITAKKSA